MGKAANNLIEDMWIPSQEYTEEDASEAIRKSRFILDSLEKFIKSQSP